MTSCISTVMSTTMSCMCECNQICSWNCIFWVSNCILISCHLRHPIMPKKSGRGVFIESTTTHTAKVSMGQNRLNKSFNHVWIVGKLVRVSKCEFLYHIEHWCISVIFWSNLSHIHHVILIHNLYLALFGLWSV